MLPRRGFSRIRRRQPGLQRYIPMLLLPWKTPRVRPNLALNPQRVRVQEPDGNVTGLNTGQKIIRGKAWP